MIHQPTLMLVPYITYSLGAGTQAEATAGGDRGRRATVGCVSWGHVAAGCGGWGDGHAGDGWRASCIESSGAVCWWWCGRSGSAEARGEEWERGSSSSGWGAEATKKTWEAAGGRPDGSTQGQLRLQEWPRAAPTGDTHDGRYCCSAGGTYPLRRWGRV